MDLGPTALLPRALSQEIRDERATNQQNYERSKDALDSLGQRLAELQAKVKTAELQKQLQETKRQLEQTRKALAPGPKAELTFSLTPVDETSLKPVLQVSTRAVDRTVKLRAYIVNLSSVPAMNGKMWIRICDSCKFVKEPDEFRRLPDAPETERMRDFGAFFVETNLSHALQLEIAIPPGTKRFEVSFRYGCETCIPKPQWQNAWVTVLD